MWIIKICSVSNSSIHYNIVNFRWKQFLKFPVGQNHGQVWKANESLKCKVRWSHRSTVLMKLLLSDREKDVGMGRQPEKYSDFCIPPCLYRQSIYYWAAWMHQLSAGLHGEQGWVQWLSSYARISVWLRAKWGYQVEISVEKPEEGESNNIGARGMALWKSKSNSHRKRRKPDLYPEGKLGEKERNSSFWTRNKFRKWLIFRDCYELQIKKEWKRHSDSECGGNP